MILQYFKDKGEYYLEADCIGIYKADISDIEEKTRENIIAHIAEKIPTCVESIILDTDNIFDDESLKKCNEIKLAVLSDGNEKNNNKVLAFREEQQVYVLNNSGKTIKRM